MTYKLLTQFNVSEGLQVPLVYVNEITNGVFINLLLFSFFIIVTMGIFYAQQKKIGEGDLPVALGVGSIVSFGFMVFMSLIPGLINSTTFAIGLVLTLICVLWLFLDKKS